MKIGLKITELGAFKEVCLILQQAVYQSKGLIEYYIIPYGHKAI
jgi:hypothetical protein